MPGTRFSLAANSSPSYGARPTGILKIVVRSLGQPTILPQIKAINHCDFKGRKDLIANAETVHEWSRGAHTPLAAEVGLL